MCFDLTPPWTDVAQTFIGAFGLLVQLAGLIGIALTYLSLQEQIKQGKKGEIKYITERIRAMLERGMREREIAKALVAFERQGTKAHDLLDILELELLPRTELRFGGISFFEAVRREMDDLRGRK